MRNSRALRMIIFAHLWYVRTYARIFMWSFRWRSTTSTMWIVHLRCEIFKHFSIEHFLGEFLLALWSTTLWLCTGAHISAENAWTKIDCVCMAKVAVCLTHSNFLYLSLSLSFASIVPFPLAWILPYSSYTYLLFCLAYWFSTGFIVVEFASVAAELESSRIAETQLMSWTWRKCTNWKIVSLKKKIAERR